MDDERNMSIWGLKSVVSHSRQHVDISVSVMTLQDCTYNEQEGQLRS